MHSLQYTQCVSIIVWLDCQMACCVLVVLRVILCPATCMWIHMDSNMHTIIPISHIKNMLSLIVKTLCAQDWLANRIASVLGVQVPKRLRSIEIHWNLAQSTISFVGDAMRQFILPKKWLDSCRAASFWLHPDFIPFRSHSILAVIGRLTALPAYDPVCS